MSRVLALLLALAAWACSGVTLLIGLLWGLGLKCDESCNDGGGWKNNPDAWQWYAIAALGALSFVAGSAFAVFVWRRKPLAATVAAVVGFAAAAALLNPLSSAWIDHLDRRSPGELLLMVSAVFAPILALLLSIEPRRRAL